MSLLVPAIVFGLIPYFTYRFVLNYDGPQWFAIVLAVSMGLFSGAFLEIVFRRIMQRVRGAREKRLQSWLRESSAGRAVKLNSIPFGYKLILFFCVDGVMTAYEWLGGQLTGATLVGRFGLGAIYSLILAAAWQWMEPKKQ